MFSSSLKITDTNDFIAPSVDCVVLDNPVRIETTGEVQIQRPRVGHGVTVAGTDQADSAVKISLHDCLACSGCVTSAETVLLEQQSIDQFHQTLRDPGKQVVVTLSNQSLASLANKAGLQPRVIASRLSRALKAHGARAVFDISVASKIALLENLSEFERRVVDRDEGGRLPMLTSSCPGWVLYVEKTHPHLIPFVSSVKSPQAIMGTLLKQFWCGTEEVRLAPDAVFHVSVMPCYDKKLEAVREELMSGSVPETDCVLTTGELETWLNKYEARWIDGPEEQGREAQLDTLFVGDDVDTRSNVAWTDVVIGKADAVESGGYMNFLYRRMFERDRGRRMAPDEDIPMRTGRNQDVRECELELESGRTLHFAILNGFRNIQGLVRKMKLNKCVYDYVEVMACPSGCVNGAGQLSTPQTQAERDESMRGVKDAMQECARGDAEDAQVNVQCASIYRHWVGQQRHVFSTTLKSTASKSKQSMLPANW